MVTYAIMPGGQSVVFLLSCRFFLDAISVPPQGEFLRNGVDKEIESF
jgi:hypothetical protein